MPQQADSSATNWAKRQVRTRGTSKTRATAAGPEVAEILAETMAATLVEEAVETSAEVEEEEILEVEAATLAEEAVGISKLE